ncbi:winged helix-turn-helix domain-containing protein [Limnospira fusiformis KN01]|uniref:winged helix-turn-helix domain-containing protein n=1 Tax=Limnospira fusiformis TaxID=54297 RepID=UPI001658AA00|nr:winged helix-turn-helix domain-containing protein [Limnospira fusiformis]ULB45979.1 winged helix-turn-helix domain-containing protein [Limnospira fusiformis KN01]
MKRQSTPGQLSLAISSPRVTELENPEPFDPGWDDQDVLRCLRSCPNQDIKQISQATGLLQSRVIKSLERLREQGKVKYLGWVAVTQGDENLSPVKTSQSDRLTVRWKTKSASQDTNGNKYAYLYQGKKQVCYLAGPHLSEKAKAIANQVEQWIESDWSLETILEKLPALKSGGRNFPGGAS